MTRAHFERFAAAIAAEVDYLLDCRGFQSEKVGRLITTARLAASFAEIAAEANPRFDRGRFAVACHLPASLMLFADISEDDGTAACFGYAADGKTKVRVA